jgi:putative membrane protein
MMEIFLYILLGLVFGIIFGLIPGLHPNIVALFIPLIATIDAGPANMIAFIVTVAVSNTFVDFVPSMLLGAPEPGKELAALPAHRMLLEGSGYEAVKLAVVGGVGAVILISALLPLTSFVIPAVYAIVKPYTWLLLAFIVFLIISSENSNRKKLISFVCFVLAGMIGIFSSSLSIDRILVLFPMLSGLFGVSMLLISTQNKLRIRKKAADTVISSRQTRRAVLFGSLGGFFSGLLPGVGASEVAALSSVDKNEKSFLMTVGAVTIANTVMSMLAIWLISNPRSGAAVMMDQLVSIGTNEAIFIAAVSLAVAGISAVITLRTTRKFLKKIENTDYTKINWAVITVILAATALFTGLQGLLLLGTCTALGIYANKSGIRRSTLMGVLILPTILFYLPF